MRTSLRAVAATLAVALAGLALGPAARADQSCPMGARCGSVQVPLDRGNPTRGTIAIAYAVFTRTEVGRPSLGTVVPNPGGPGQTAIGSAALYLQALAPLRRRRDLLLIDPRGTGRSGALACPDLHGRDPLALDPIDIGRLCGADLGADAGLYGTAAVADDIDAVRATLGLDRLDLWGDSYGTYLMSVYAARHPDHVRSVVLDGAFPIASDPWGRDVLKGTRRVIALVCRRTRRCSGAHVLGEIERVAGRLRRHPVAFTATTPVGPVGPTLDEKALAEVTFGGGHPEVYGLLPAAVHDAVHGDFAPLERLVTGSEVSRVESLFIDPRRFSLAAAVATSCHDYPRPYDLAASPAVRRTEYRRGLGGLKSGTFAPFSAAAWLGTGIDAGPKCLDSPVDPTAGSPLEGHPFPDVPVLVQSGDLDTNTPIEQGRAAAAQFPDATFAVIANAGHTPDLRPCGVAMAIRFVERLHTDPDRCRHVGRPPHVVASAGLRGAPKPSLDLVSANPSERNR